MSDPREYLKIKYSAPTGACKCGKCQLVPPEALARWQDELEGALAAMAGMVREADRNTNPFVAARTILQRRSVR